MSDLEHFSGDGGSIYFFGCFIIIDDNFFFKIFQDLNLERGCWSMIDNWMGWSMM